MKTIMEYAGYRPLCLLRCLWGIWVSSGAQWPVPRTFHKYGMTRAPNWYWDDAPWPEAQVIHAWGSKTDWLPSMKVVVMNQFEGWRGIKGNACGNQNLCSDHIASSLTLKLELNQFVIWIWTIGDFEIWNWFWRTHHLSFAKTKQTA
jgi:hypothetical protein